MGLRGGGGRLWRGGGLDSPFNSVMRSARCRARTSEKWPASEESRSFCLSIAGGVSAVASALTHHYSASACHSYSLDAPTVGGGSRGNVLGGLAWLASLEAAPFAADTLLLLDMVLAAVLVLFTACG